MHVSDIRNVLVVGALGGILVLIGLSVDIPRGGSSAAAHAAEIVRACESADHRPSCYEKQVPALLTELTIPEVFGVIREIRERDPDYQFCHVLAHELGSREVAKDPQQWTSVITKNPTDGLCSNGLIHGAALERFNKEVFTEAELDRAVIPELKTACEARAGWNPTELDRAICYHGIGHLSIHLTQADIPAALSVCEKVAQPTDGDFRRVCYEGVFMQLFQPLEPEDHALIDKLAIQPSRENLDQFCSGWGEAADAACWREGWPFFRDEILTADGMEAFCAHEKKPAYRHACFNTTIAILGRSSLDQTDRAAAVCGALAEGDRRAQCMSNVALTLLEEDRTNGAAAVAFCKRAGEPVVTDQCFQFLSQTADFVYHPTDPHRAGLCRALPSDLQESCLSEHQ